MGDDGYGCLSMMVALRFLSTSPVWGTTRKNGFATIVSQAISIHVPRMGDDCKPTVD